MFLPCTNEAETLAEAPPEEELQGAAMCTSGLFLPSYFACCLRQSFFLWVSGLGERGVIYIYMYI